jgi:hypothetical protein
MSVYKKLSTIQAAMRSLAANAEGQTGQAKYGYVSGSKLLGFLRPLMDKEHLILSQEVVDIKNEPISYMTRNGEKTEMFTTLKIRFTWIDSEDETTLVNEFYANGMNAWDKGLGSALTYAERYYLMKWKSLALKARFLICVGLAIPRMIFIRVKRNITSKICLCFQVCKLNIRRL